jgi:hypothetical protein
VVAENIALLTEAERTEDWDLQKLRGLLTALEPGVLYMNEEEFHRRRIQLERLQKLYRERIGTSLGS